MAVEVKESWTGKVNTLKIGENNQLNIGGINTLPFLKFEGNIPNSPKIAAEIWDVVPENWPKILKEEIGTEINDPLKWANKILSLSNPDLITLRIMSIHPENKNKPISEVIKVVDNLAKNLKIPLMVIGCGIPDKDGDLMVQVSQLLKGKNAILGIAVEENYRTMAAAALSGEHFLITETPIDLNLAKQLNILISDVGFPKEKIIVHHATGALGYGLEYTYSIMERNRLAALQGDEMLSQPMIIFIGQEVWKTKEAKLEDLKAKDLNWGNQKLRAVLWEVTAAVAFLQSGADLLVLNHPHSIRVIKNYLNDILTN
jgi:acetyl-CoA decarbonylase/synthase complex subunit delta